MNGRRNVVQHGMQGVFVFVLLGLFAVMSTLMVLLGAQMYRDTVRHTDGNNGARALGAYVRSMVRAEDAAGSVSVEDRGGVKALALRETFGDEEYVTWLYCYEGRLYEQFTGSDHDFAPEDGTAVCPATGFEPSLDGNLLTVDLVDGAGEPRTVQVALRCAQ